MNCSSFESLIEHYLEDDLLPRERVELALHLDRCRSCADLFEEVRVVDALLLEPRELEPAPNFTFRIMAEVRAAPPPVVRRTRIVPWLAGYLAVSWLAVALACVFAGSHVRAALGWVMLASAHAGSALGDFVHDLLLSPRSGAGGAFAFAGSVLLLDVALAVTLGIAYFVIRPRLAARLAADAEVRSCDAS